MKVNELINNHQGDTVDNDDEVDPKMFPTGDLRCPVKLFLEYDQKRNKANDIYFQQPKAANWLGKDTWYTSRPVGSRTLGEIMAKLSIGAQLSKRYTNHSIRATTINVLGRSGFNNREIISITNHKSASASLESYLRDMDDDGKKSANKVFNSS